jgi:hypothetical protein
VKAGIKLSTLHSLKKCVLICYKCLEIDRGKQNKVSWWKKDLASATITVHGDKSARSVSTSFNIPLSTLQERISEGKTKESEARKK